MLLFEVARRHVQSRSRSLSGVVDDGTGLVNPGVEIEVAKEATCLHQAVWEDEVGRNIFSQPAPADYDLISKQEGFADLRMERNSVRVDTAASNGSSWPTNWCGDDFAGVNGWMPRQTNTKNGAYVGDGLGPNLLDDSAAVRAVVEPTRVGANGVRGNLGGCGRFSLDFSVGKRFRLPLMGHSIRFRTAAFGDQHNALQRQLEHV